MAPTDRQQQIILMEMNLLLLSRGPTLRLHAVTAGVCGQTSLCQTHWLQHPPRPAELQLATHN
ncbi:hypothetical protein EYF80_015179 [Liparis tanakae]|uniref:Uncharacterized protein n=1 Tax=Liparis tanakae TaxID=230148 RepID=A0A4Z2IB56_9TELE|nr:hypothetical protein EYF80_015179 [Liparis tanakae]